MTDSVTRRPADSHGLGEASRPDGARRARGLRVLGGLLPEIALLTVAAVLWQQAGSFRAVPPGDLGPAFWPRALIILLSVCVLVRVTQKARAILSADQADGLPPDPSTSLRTAVAEVEVRSDDEDQRQPAARKVVIAILIIVGYVLGAIYLGYLIATAAFVISFLFLAGRRNLLVNATVGTGAALAFSYVFLKVVYIAVPSGVGGFDAFTVWVYGLIGIY